MSDPMFNTLYAKLAGVLLGLFCLIGTGVILLTLYTTRLYFQEVNQKLNQTLAERMVSEHILLQGGQVNEAGLKDMFHTLMVINPSIEVYLLDTQGMILTFSAPAEKVKRAQISLAPVKRFLSGAEDLPILGDDPRDRYRRKIFSAFPIESLSGETEGYLYVILGGEELDSVAQMLEGSYILRVSMGAAVATLLFALLAGLVLFKLMTRRLRRLALAMETFKRGNFSELPNLLPQLYGRALTALPGDEMDQLGTTFVHLADRIQQQVGQLKQTDQLRRELVADVSHDLRTPLTSLQGYLETMLLKGATLSIVDQRKYLEVATAQSQHLGRLITELFELAKLNSREIMPHREPFSLGELVQDVVQKLRLIADKKQLTLQARFGTNLPQVSADIGLMERVLENLIANAIRHTEERGTITVALSLIHEKIMTQVTDTGCGISSEDLPFIFDRYHRSRNGRQEKTAGAGLGLAIAKRILELHGTAIEAQSTVNAGTTFCFELPIASRSHDASPVDAV
ncbi:MAG: HAMP domain-containing protein [Nitrospira sp.]|nr:HAMP domain-containing protein [Nitrospira sp.]